MISQADGARLMWLHDVAVQRLREYEAHANGPARHDRTIHEDYRAAERAFADLVATLVEPE